MTINKTKIAVLSIILTATCSMQGQSISAAEGHNSIESVKNLTYKQPCTPILIDNYLFSSYHANGKHAYNLKGFETAKTSDQIQSIKVNPAGSSYALLTSNGKTSGLKVYSMWGVNEMIYDFMNTLNPQSIVYSADSRYLFVMCKNGMLNKYDTKSYQLIDSWSAPVIFTDMQSSNNGYYIAGLSGNSVYVINPENHTVRTILTSTSNVCDVDFSKDSSMLVVLWSDGKIEVVDTRNFQQACSPMYRVGATAISFHPDNKYIAVAKEGREIEVFNILNESENANLSEMQGSVSYVRFLQDGKDNTYLTYNTKNAIIYKLIKGLLPNYSKMLREEVMARMEEWSKMMPDETEEAYRARVNDETRLTQVRLFEEEIATRMADDFVLRSNISLGAYNPKDQTLTLEFDNMPPVYLTVPENDMSDFMDISNIEIKNAIYGITADDKFELVYADVYNKATGKTYEFNNRERKSLDYIFASADFVPIELVQQTGMEEIRLTGIKNDIVNKAIMDQRISNHTQIDVKTNILSDYDALGNKITNYKVNFRYTVDAGFSAKEDFPAGKYNIAASNAAQSMLQVIAQSFASDLAQYVKPGKKVVVTITGSADALPVNGTIAYDGSYGDYVNEPYYLGKELSNITVTKQTGIKNNEQLAFTRALAVRDYIGSNIHQLSMMNADYIFNVEVADKKGSEYRRINVEFTFIDAF